MPNVPINPNGGPQPQIDPETIARLGQAFQQGQQRQKMNNPQGGRMQGGWNPGGGGPQGRMSPQAGQPGPGGSRYGPPRQQETSQAGGITSSRYGAPQAQGTVQTNGPQPSQGAGPANYAAPSGGVARQVNMNSMGSAGQHVPVGAPQQQSQQYGSPVSPFGGGAPLAPAPGGGQATVQSPGGDFQYGGQAANRAGAAPISGIVGGNGGMSTGQPGQQGGQSLAPTPGGGFAAAAPGGGVSQMGGAPSNANLQAASIFGGPPPPAPTGSAPVGGGQPTFGANSPAWLQQQHDENVQSGPVQLQGGSYGGGQSV
jgi:hypothetical protein